MSFLFLHTGRFPFLWDILVSPSPLHVYVLIRVCIHKVTLQCVSFWTAFATLRFLQIGHAHVIGHFGCVKL